MTGPTNPTAFVYDAPTQFQDDNSAMPAGTVAKYQMGFGQASGTYTLIKDDVDLTADANGKQTTPVSIAGQLAYGQWYSAVRAVSKDGVVSAWSAEVSFVLAAKTPKAPTGFSVS